MLIAFFYLNFFEVGETKEGVWWNFLEVAFVWKQNLQYDPDRKRLNMDEKIITVMMMIDKN